MDFFFNALRGAAATRQLPYTRVAYLESTGTQWIDTGVAPDFANGDEIEIRYLSADYSGAAPCIFGSRDTGVKKGVYALASAVTVADNDGYSAAANLSIGENTVKISDTSIVVDATSHAMPRRVTCARSMYLFALDNAGATYGIYNGLRIMEWTYKRNGSVAQHLVPALDENGTPCMWDTVSNTAKYNAGSGVFKWNETPYQRELAYLESTGTQYIDTGVAPDWDTSVTFKGTGVQPFNSGTVTQGSFFGGGGTAHMNEMSCYVWAGQFQFHFFNSSSPTWTGVVSGVDFEFVQNGVSVKVYQSGATKVDATMSNPTQTPNTNDLWLFAVNRTNAFTSAVAARIHYFKLYDGSSLVRDFIPVLDWSGAPCMYDKVSGQLFYNAGTGTFNYGELS